MSKVLLQTHKVQELTEILALFLLNIYTDILHREENSPSLPSHKTNSSPVFGPDIQGTRSVGSVFRGNTLAPFNQIQNAMNLSQWEKRLLPLFFFQGFRG